MALQSSGAISISQIAAELGSGSYSLRTLSSAAGKSTPDAMSEFYGYDATPTPSCYYYYTTYSGYFDYYDCGGVWRSEYFPYGEGVCAQSVVSGGFSNSGTGCLA